MWAYICGPGVGNDYPLQYSCLENPMKLAWQATDSRVAKSDMTEATEHSYYVDFSPVSELFLARK